MELIPTLEVAFDIDTDDYILEEHIYYNGNNVSIEIALDEDRLENDMNEALKLMSN